MAHPGLPLGATIQTLLAKPQTQPFSGSPSQQRTFVQQGGWLAALKEAVLGSARLRELNVPAAQARGQAERLAALPQQQRFATQMRDLRTQFVAAERKQGQPLAPELGQQLRLHNLRYGAYKKAGISTAAGDYQQKALASDLRVMRDLGLADAQQVGAWLRWSKTASKDEIAKQRAAAGEIGRFFPSDWINRAAKQLNLTVPH
jgi:hypothetical protein